MRIGRYGSGDGSQQALATQSQGGSLHIQQAVLPQQAPGTHQQQPANPGSISGIWGASSTRDSPRASTAAAAAGGAEGGASGAGASELQPAYPGAPGLATTSTGGDSAFASGQLSDSNLFDCTHPPGTQTSSTLIDMLTAAGAADGTQRNSPAAGHTPGGGSTNDLPILGASSTGWPVATASVLPPDAVLGALKELREVDPSLFLILWVSEAWEELRLLRLRTLCISRLGHGLPDDLHALT